MVADLDDTETTEMLIQRVQTYQDALERLLRVVREHASTEASAGSVRAALRNFDDETKRLNAVTAKKPAKKSSKEIMKVAELIAKLQGMPQDSIVVLQKDAEGNGYSPLSGVDPNSTYVAKEDMVYSPVDRAGGYGEGGVPCVVLYPL